VIAQNNKRLLEENIFYFENINFDENCYLWKDIDINYFLNVKIYNFFIFKKFQVKIDLSIKNYQEIELLNSQ